MSDRADDESPATDAGEQAAAPAPLDADSPPPSDSSDDVVVDASADAEDAPAAGPEQASEPPSEQAPEPAQQEAAPTPTPTTPDPAQAAVARFAASSKKAKAAAAPAKPAPAKPAPAKPAPGAAKPAPAAAKPSPAAARPASAPARPAAPAKTPTPKASPRPAAAPAAPAAPAEPAPSEKPATKDGTGRAKRPGKPDTGTGRKKRPAKGDDDAPAPRSGPSPALLAVGGGLVGALVVAMVMVVMLRPAAPPPEQTAQQPAQASESQAPAPQDDGAALWRRLNAAQEKLAALQEEADEAAVRQGVARLERELKALRASSIGAEAKSTLDRLERQVGALGERRGDDARGGGEASPQRSEREAKLASIDEGLSELSFVVEARLFSALQAVPRSILHAAAEDQQGRGLRDRLRRNVRDARGAPRALIEVALRPELVGFLGAAGYAEIESWAVDYVGEFRTSEAWRYWEAEQLPRLTESRGRAERFEAALTQVEAAWEAKDHPAALAAVAPFRDSRYEIWGTALLGWIEQDDVKKVWGALPLRPRADEPSARPGQETDAPRKRGSGTGFFVTASVLLTNEHVVGDADTVRVQMQDRPDAKGKVLARDAGLDLALVAVEGLEGKPLAFCKESLAVGESVYVYGYGAMVTGSGVTNEQAVWTVGALSQFQKEDARRLIVFDASVNPGNSGGPLIDCGGNWIGVVVAKTRSLEWIDGYGYAVHGEDARRWVDEHLGDRGKVATTSAPDQPLRASVIARRLPASVVRIVVGD